MKRFKLTEQANADLELLGDYIARDNKNAAFCFVQRIKLRCRELAENPGTGRKREDLAPELRTATEGDYLTAYGIEIIRIVHGKRDIPRLFKADH